jgi:hypothetical protein
MTFSTPTTTCTPVTYERRTTSKISNPVVVAMLNSNIMGDCSQVRDMFYQCKASDGQSIICDTAMKYFERCTPSGGHTFEESR